MKNTLENKHPPLLCDVLDATDAYIVSIGKDRRGNVISFIDEAQHNPHIASVNPGAIRGNHVHDQDEVICFMGGADICEISLENPVSGEKEQFLVDETIKTYRFRAGIKHTVKNIGDNEFYLFAFLT